MPMSRESLLETAKQYTFTAEASLTLAAQPLTADAVSARVEKIQALSAETNGKRIWLVRLVLAAGIATFGLFFAALICKSMWCLGMAVGALAVLGTAGWLEANQADRYVSYCAQLAGLKPIAGTQACLRALESVESGHPQVLAWRDLAVAERGQLYAFDVDIMQYLHFQSEKRQEEAAGLRRVEEACRKVHGLEPAAA